MDEKECGQHMGYFEIEETILKLIKKFNWKGFPSLLTQGFDKVMEMRYIAINKFDVDLETLFQKLKNKLSKSTIINIGLQLVSSTHCCYASECRLIG